jgi:glycosyltransferase involved in cell wall biosynthesis
MVNHPEEREEMSKNAFERAKDYKWENIVNQFYELYQQ